MEKVSPMAPGLEVAEGGMGGGPRAREQMGARQSLSSPSLHSHEGTTVSQHSPVISGLWEDSVPLSLGSSVSNNKQAFPSYSV